METSGSTPAAAGNSQAEQDRKALQLMLEYVCTDTRADGCAATINLGSTVLKASVGNPQAATDPVAAIRAECLRSSEVIDCEDAGAEARADAEGCRKAGIGAFVAVPVLVGSKAVGVVEMYSAQPYNFMPNDVDTVRRVAAVIAALVWRK